MPGLRLTVEQVQRLCGEERELCRRVLDVLVDEKFLCLNAHGLYARLTGPTFHIGVFDETRNAIERLASTIPGHDRSRDVTPV